ncbi:hypothetical protein ACKWRH_46480 (plasmid) [Bradyrhizobium sp. Pa8]|uniref:hypothetical protein n=1 Tax=Bradyrhizobium sp. Pa8 TaxID=3386552 RepID=UPI00403F28E3
MSNLGVQLFDLAFARVLAFPPDTRVKGPGRLVPQLLLPGIDLVRVNLIALARSATVACSRTVSSAIFAFSPASILRLVFVLIMRSVYQTEQRGAKIGVHFRADGTI